MPVRPEGMPKAAQEKLPDSGSKLDEITRLINEIQPILDRLVQQKKSPDFDVQLENLTQELEESLGDGMDRDDLITIITRVFEHSITDGLTLSQRFRLTQQEIKEAVCRHEFQTKHKQVAEKFLQLANQHKKPIGFGYWTGSKRPGNDAKQYLKKIDALFAPLLATRELKLGPREKAQETGDKLAERFLTKVKRAYEHHYYTGPVKKLREKERPDVR